MIIYEYCTYEIYIDLFVIPLLTEEAVEQSKHLSKLITLLFTLTLLIHFLCTDVTVDRSIVIEFIVLKMSA
jgi:hypothetical protein